MYCIRRGEINVHGYLRCQELGSFGVIHVGTFLIEAG